MQRRHLIGVIVILNLTAGAGWGQRTTAPTAADITAARLAVELNTAGVVRAKEASTREAAFTPIKQPAKFTHKMLEDGIVLGELRPKNLTKEIGGGLYIIYVCKVGKRFDAFAVQDAIKPAKLSKLIMNAQVDANAFKTAKAAPTAKADIIMDQLERPSVVRIIMEIGRDRVTVTIKL